MIFNSPKFQVLSVVLLAIFWALNWPLMKIGLEVLEPWTFRALIVMVGGLGCLLVASVLGEDLFVPKSNWVALFWLTFFQGILWNAFSGFGISMVEAGRAAVLAFTMPVWATLFAIFFLGEHVNFTRALGLVLGISGLLLLLIPAYPKLGNNFLGSSLMVASAISWGCATIVVKATDWKANVLVISGWQFLIGSIPLSFAALVLGRPESIFELDIRSGLALAYSALIPMIFCQSVWYLLVQRLPTSLASMGTLLVPPLGVYFSALILEETISKFDVLALLVVSSSMILILPGFSWRAILRRREVSRPEQK